MCNKKPLQKFITQSNEKHNGKYDYSKVIYEHYRKKVVIICPIHGEFEQTPMYHLKTSGCMKCEGKNKKTTEEFIELGKKIHKGKFTYEKTIYKTVNEKVIITCPIHGDFEQFAHSHLQGAGCLKCAKFYQPTTQEFIEKAKKVHGDNYDYSKVIYKDSNTKIIVVCKEHGEFLITPTNIIKGRGCAKCFGRYKTTEEYIKEAKEIHGDKYDYSSTVYKNSTEKVKINCKIHGEFEQISNYHIRGCGCQKCNEEKSSSYNEILLKELIKLNFPKLELLSTYREHPLLKGTEIDIFLPQINLGIEWNGIYWHSFRNNKTKDKFKKQQLGKNLIQIVDYGGRSEKFVQEIFENLVKPAILERM
jgi:hypothetical protein